GSRATPVSTDSGTSTPPGGYDDPFQFHSSSNIANPLTFAHHTQFSSREPTRDVASRQSSSAPTLDWGNRHASASKYRSAKRKTGGAHTRHGRRQHHVHVRSGTRPQGRCDAGGLADAAWHYPPGQAHGGSLAADQGFRVPREAGQHRLWRVGHFP